MEQLLTVRKTRFFLSLSLNETQWEDPERHTKRRSKIKKRILFLSCVEISDEAIRRIKIRAGPTFEYELLLRECLFQRHHEPFQDAARLRVGSWLGALFCLVKKQAMLTHSCDSKLPGGRIWGTILVGVSYPSTFFTGSPTDVIAGLVPPFKDEGGSLRFLRSGRQWLLLVARTKKKHRKDLLTFLWVM